MTIRYSNFENQPNLIQYKVTVKQKSKKKI